MRTFFLAFGLTLLSSCASLQKQVDDVALPDAQAALVLAQNANDKVAVAYLQNLISCIQSLQVTAPSGAAALTAIEELRIIKMRQLCIGL